MTENYLLNSYKERKCNKETGVQKRLLELEFIYIDKNTNIKMSPVAISTMFLLLLLLLLLLLKLRRIYFMLTGHLGGSKSQPAS